MLKDFNSHLFKPHIIIPTIPIEMWGKIVTVEVEVVDYLVDYNLLLGRSWTQSTMDVVYPVFHVINFLHNVKIDDY